MAEAVGWIQNVPEGWHGIVIDLVADLEAIASRERLRSFEIRSIGEKWGYLNVSLLVYSDALTARIEAAEELSGRTCKRCGGPAGPMRRYRGWVQNTCGTCISE